MRLFLVMAFYVCVALCQPFQLRGNEPGLSTLLPENTPVDRFFKYSFNHLERGDVKSLTAVMMDAYLDLCRTMGGCRRAGDMLGELYRRRYVDVEINMGKMHKLGMILQRLITIGRIPEDGDDEEDRG